MRLAAFLGSALLLFGGATPALAQRATLSETATITSHTPGQVVADAFGNRVVQGSVFTGQIVGSPVSGSFRMVVDMTFSAGSLTGEIDGSLVAFDTQGNALYGEITQGQVTDSGGSLTVNGRFSIQGGTGVFDDSRGRGTFQGSLPLIAQASPLTAPAGYQYGNPYPPMYAPMAGLQPYPMASTAVSGSLRLTGNLRLDDEDLAFWNPQSPLRQQQLLSLLQLVDESGTRAIVMVDDQGRVRSFDLERVGNSGLLRIADREDNDNRGWRDRDGDGDRDHPGRGRGRNKH